MRHIFLIGLFLTCHLTTNAQYEIRTSNFVGISFNYGGMIPAADLGDRFGSFFKAGTSLCLFNHKQKMIMGIEGEVMFGENVKENVLAPLQLDNNAFLGNDGNYADVFLRMRGTYLGLYMNKVLKPFNENPNAGLTLGLGLGIIQHRIRLNVESDNAPQFSGEYEKGYDRNSVGPALKQSIQYMNIGRYNNFNYAIELVVMEGFTKNNRPINFDTKLKDDSSQLDIAIGLNLKWYLPLKDMRTAEEIFY